MKVITAQMSNLKEILEIYQYARTFMEEHGNPSQWGKTKPEKEQIIADIEQKNCYICVESEKILAVFFFRKGEDSTYQTIDGHWKNHEPYAVIHRIASAPHTKGAATFCLLWAYKQHPNIRIDTHKDNKPMQNLLKKLGFEYCGVITLEDGSLRMAFQKYDVSKNNKNQR